MSLYRIYIDEVGNDSMKSGVVSNPNEQFLSLSGVIFESSYYANTFCPCLDQFKTKYIPDYPDDPPGKAYSLHRKDIVKTQNGFGFLRDISIKTVFDKDLMNIINQSQYKVISVVIDKLNHLTTYRSFHYHPYHYCLEALLERYVMFLEDNQSIGDVMIESINKKKDMALKKSFRAIYQYGTPFINKDRIQSVISSRDIKMKNKVQKIAGLQLADLVAHPSYWGIRNQKFREPPVAGFGLNVFNILQEQKYHRTGTNRIWGVGIKWL